MKKKASGRNKYIQRRFVEADAKKKQRIILIVIISVTLAFTVPWLIYRALSVKVIDAKHPISNCSAGDRVTITTSNYIPSGVKYEFERSDSDDNYYTVTHYFHFIINEVEGSARREFIAAEESWKGYVYNKTFKGRLGKFNSREEAIDFLVKMDIPREEVKNGLSPFFIYDDSDEAAAVLIVAGTIVGMLGLFLLLNIIQSRRKRD